MNFLTSFLLLTNFIPSTSKAPTSKPVKTTFVYTQRVILLKSVEREENLEFVKRYSKNIRFVYWALKNVPKVHPFPCSIQIKAGNQVFPISKPILSSSQGIYTFSWQMDKLVPNFLASISCSKILTIYRSISWKFCYPIIGSIFRSNGRGGLVALVVARRPLRGCSPVPLVNLVVPQYLSWRDILKKYSKQSRIQRAIKKAFKKICTDPKHMYHSCPYELDRLKTNQEEKIPFGVH